MKQISVRVIIFGLLFILNSNLTFSQDNISTWLSLTYSGFKPKVFDVEKNKASDLYEKAKKWAELNYPNIENELIYDSLNYCIKIRSTKPEAFHIGLERNLYDIDYTLKISFKDNKYRLEVELNAFFYNPRNTKYRSEGVSQETGWDQREFYIHEKELDPKNRTGYTELNNTMYEISTSLYKSMSQKNEEQKVEENDDW